MIEIYFESILSEWSWNAFIKIGCTTQSIQKCDSKCTFLHLLWAYLYLLSNWHNYLVLSLHCLVVSFVFSFAMLPYALGICISFSKDRPPELSSLKHYCLQNRALRRERFGLGVTESFKMRRGCYYEEHGLCGLIPATRL